MPEQSIQSILSLSPGFSLPVIAPPESEGASFSKTMQRAAGNLTCRAPELCRNYAPCTTFRGATHCAMEWDIWVIVRALVTPAHAVIEYGARYGTSSCVLAEATANSGRVVSVEPDTSAHADLLHNRQAHRCNFHIVLGTVAAHPLAHTGHGKMHHTYAFTTQPNGTYGTNGPAFPNACVRATNR